MNLFSLTKLILFIFYLVLPLPLGLFAAWFLFRAQTWTGVGLPGLAILGVLLPVPLAFWLTQPAQRPGWSWISLPLVLIEAGLLGLILWQTPGGVPAPGSPVQHRFVQSVSFPRYTLANIVLEIEQINLGFVVTLYLDRLFTTEQARQGVLVITGAADERIPLSYIQQRAATFNAGGIAITEQVYPGETHFLFFSQPEAVLSDISAWLAATAQ